LSAARHKIKGLKSRYCTSTKKVFQEKHNVRCVPKKLRAEVHKLTRKIRREDWDAFVKRLGRDITGAQRMGFKVLKKLQQEERDRLNIVISSQVLFTMDVYYTPNVNTQLLITIYNSSRNLTHV
jgi:hypothetical protein